MLTAAVFADAEGHQLIEIEEPENSRRGNVRWAGNCGQGGGALRRG